jgi:hypothetical protein
LKKKQSRGFFFFENKGPIINVSVIPGEFSIFEKFTNSKKKQSRDRIEKKNRVGKNDFFLQGKALE